MSKFKTAITEILRLESLKELASSADEQEEITAEILILRKTSHTASIFYTLREINARTPLLFPFIVVSVLLLIFS